MKDYSQYNEQRVILEFFTGFIGVYLSCGENDGATFSNVKALHDLGWIGTSVEPSRAAYELLRKNQPNALCIQAAIATSNGPVTFWESGAHLGGNNVSLLSTIRPEEMERWRNSGEKFEQTTVRGITVDTMLAEAGYSYYDFISIDCEGVDYEILCRLNLSAMRCRMLCVEYNGKDAKKYIDYCGQHGLTLHYHNNVNLIFTRK